MPPGRGGDEQARSRLTAAGQRACPAEQHSRNQKRRPERPPQAESLPHKKRWPNQLPASWLTVMAKPLFNLTTAERAAPVLAATVYVGVTVSPATHGDEPGGQTPGIA